MGRQPGQEGLAHTPLVSLPAVGSGEAWFGRRICPICLCHTRNLGTVAVGLLFLFLSFSLLPFVHRIRKAPPCHLQGDIINGSVLINKQPLFHVIAATQVGVKLTVTVSYDDVGCSAIPFMSAKIMCLAGPHIDSQLDHAHTCWPTTWSSVLPPPRPCTLLFFNVMPLSAASALLVCVLSAENHLPGV